MDREREKKNELRKKRIMKELVGKGGLDGRGIGKSGVGVDEDDKGGGKDIREGVRGEK